MKERKIILNNMYSQHKEEAYIVDYFKNKIGTLVDIGAFNPVTFSNTRRLFENGWKCAFVEPSKICFENFIKEYSNNERVQLFNCAIGTYDGKITFYESKGDALSTTSETHLKKWKNVKFDKTEVDVFEINSFLDKFETIDFLSIDVESTNYELFLAISDKHLNRIKMLCIEHDNKSNQITERLRTFGFRLIYFNPENIILAK